MPTNQTLIADGDWSNSANWSLGHVPTTGEDVLLTYPVTFDVVHSATSILSLHLQTGIILTVDNTIDTYLKCAGDITGDTSSIYRALLSSGGAEHVVDFVGGSNSFDCVSGLVLDIQCQEPADQYYLTTAAGSQSQVITDSPTSDIWKAGDTIHINNVNNGRDSEEHIIDNISANQITVVGTIASTKEIGTKVILITRNIRIINSTDYAVKDVTGSTINAEIYNCTNGIDTAIECSVGGSISDNVYGLRDGRGIVLTGAVSNCTYGLYQTQNITVAGIISGCLYGTGYAHAVMVALAGIISGCAYAISRGSGQSVMGEVSGCTYGIFRTTIEGMSAVLANLYDMLYVPFAKCSNTLFNGSTEVSGYDTAYMPANGYIESIDHDRVAEAFIAWTRGGTVKMKIDDPAPGQIFAYKHSNGEEGHVCFKQDERIIEAGETLLVKGYLKIESDQSDYAPRVEIVSPIADPLVESSNAALASVSIPVADGTDTSFQAIELSYENTTGKAMPVLVRTSTSDAANAAWSFIEEEIMGLEELQADVDTLLAGVITLLAGVNITKIGGDTTTAARLAEAAKFIVNETTQDKATGVITVFDNDGTTPILTITPTDDGSTIAKARS